jgi:hypothetical protein
MATDTDFRSELISGIGKLVKKSVPRDASTADIAKVVSVLLCCAAAISQQGCGEEVDEDLSADMSVAASKAFRKVMEQRAASDARERG